MAIALFGCTKGGNTVVKLDDVTVATDEGAAFTAFYQPCSIDFGPAGGEGRLRLITQAITVGANTVLTITPIANGAELPEQAQPFLVFTSEGETQILESAVAALGTRFSYKVALTTIGGPCEFGEADVVMINKRSATRG